MVIIFYIHPIKFLPHTSSHSAKEDPQFVENTEKRVCSNAWITFLGSDNPLRAFSLCLSWLTKARLSWFKEAHSFHCFVWLVMISKVFGLRIGALGRLMMFGVLAPLFGGLQLLLVALSYVWTYLWQKDGVDKHHVVCLSSWGLATRWISCLGDPVIARLKILKASRRVLEVG